MTPALNFTRPSTATRFAHNGVAYSAARVAGAKESHSYINKQSTVKLVRGCIIIVNRYALK